MKPVVVIPAYQPDGRLVELVNSLVQTNAFKAIVAVDDGSGQEHRPYFDQISRIPTVTVLRHITNMGQGAADKTGMNYAACTFPDSPGVVTADADGQHVVEDIRRVAEGLLENPRKMILGVRDFSGPEVPFRSRLGNVMTRHLLRLVGGQRVSDTQTGLRAVPMSMIPSIVKLRSNGFDFALDLLLLCKYKKIHIVEETIQTVYFDENRSSHFRPLLDSMRIYAVLFRFAIASLAAAAVDTAVFLLASSLSSSIAGAQVCARIAAVTVNYIANKKLVFHSGRSHLYSLPKYLLLVAVSGTISYGMIMLLVSRTPLSVIAAKILAESTIFVFNFAIQRDFIFTQPDPAFQT